VGAVISPEPTPQEREALLAALAGLDGRSDAASPWWEAGIRDAVAVPDEGQFLSGESPSGLSPLD
jgi:hypothetical protein